MTLTLTAAQLLWAVGGLLQLLAMLMVWRWSAGTPLPWWGRLLAGFFWPLSLLVILLLARGGANAQ